MRTPEIPIRSRAGFTIIEVMIVLVIAAIIMLIVFLVVPAFQRNSRNTTRKQEVSRLAAAYQEFTVNKNGVKPTTSTTDRNEIIKLAGGIKSIEAVNLALSNSAVGSTGDPDYAYIRTGASNTGGKCNATNTNSGGSNPVAGQIAIVYYVETFSGYRSQCLQGT